MILDIVSKYIIIDQLCWTNSKDYVHFITHADDSFEVPENWESVIYTSKNIAELLLFKINFIPRKFFHTIEPDTPITVALKNDEKCTVTLFSTELKSGNVMFHFKSENVTAFYTGYFTSYRQMLRNKLFHRIISDGIDYLYVDNTRSNSVDQVTIKSACSKIQEISNKYPHHQILMNVPAFGYEDLIYALANDYKIKTYLGKLQLKVFEKLRCSELFESNPKKATIIAGRAVFNLEEISPHFKKHNKIILRLTESNYELKNEFEKIGLFEVHWSPHPSLFQLHGFIYATRPKYVKEMLLEPEFPKLPEHLKLLPISGRLRYDIINKSCATQESQLPSQEIQQLSDILREENEDVCSPEKSNELPEMIIGDNKSNDDHVQPSKVVPEIVTDYIENFFEASISTSTLVSSEVELEKDGRQMGDTLSADTKKLIIEIFGSLSVENVCTNRNLLDEQKVDDNLNICNTSKKNEDSKEPKTTAVKRMNVLNDVTEAGVSISKGDLREIISISSTDSDEQIELRSRQLDQSRVTAKHVEFRCERKSAVSKPGTFTLNQIKFSVGSNYQSTEILYISSDDD